MKITWKNDINNDLQLNAEWEVELVRVHTVDKFKVNEAIKPALVLYIQVNEKQYRKLIDEYGKESIPSGVLGINVIRLYEGAVLWTKKSPKGYEKIIPEQRFTAFEISP